MFEHTTIVQDEFFDSTKNILFLYLEKQVRIALDATLPESVVERIIEHVHWGVQDETVHHQIKLQQSTWVTIYKEA
jgi:hypothetical protein